MLTLQNNNSISITQRDAEEVLPYHLRQTYQLLRSTPAKKKKRISKTSPKNTRLR